MNELGEMLNARGVLKASFSVFVERPNAAAGSLANKPASVAER
jgi:hypothetical protein